MVQIPSYKWANATRKTKNLKVINVESCEEFYSQVESRLPVIFLYLLQQFLTGKLENIQK